MLGKPSLDARMFFWLLAAVLLLLGIFQDALNNFLVYERSAIENGEVWRLFSAHLVHTNAWHLGMNLVGLVLCLVYFREQLSLALFLGLVCLVMPLLGLLLFYLDTDLASYLGFSGVLYGLFVALCILSWSRQPAVLSIALLAVAFRLAWEQFRYLDASGFNETIHPLLGMPVYVNVHLYGALCGALMGLSGSAYCFLFVQIRKNLS